MLNAETLWGYDERGWNDLTCLVNDWANWKLFGHNLHAQIGWWLSPASSSMATTTASTSTSTSSFRSTTLCKFFWWTLSLVVEENFALQIWKWSRSDVKQVRFGQIEMWPNWHLLRLGLNKTYKIGYSVYIHSLTKTTYLNRSTW